MREYLLDSGSLRQSASHPAHEFHQKLSSCASARYSTAENSTRRVHSLVVVFTFAGRKIKVACMLVLDERASPFHDPPLQTRWQKFSEFQLQYFYLNKKKRKKEIRETEIAIHESIKRYTHACTHAGRFVPSTGIISSIEIYKEF